MEFGILGPTVVRIEEREAPLGGPKQRALLAMLLLARNRRVSRDRLIDGLWGERAPATAQHTLDGYVSRLRRLLGPDRILRSAGGYTLRVEPGELDLDRFLELGREAHEQTAAGDTATARRTFAAALALWRGPPLADVIDEPFAASEAAELEERRLAMLEERVEADLVAGAGAELVPELEELTRDNPLRERLLASLMAALYRADRQAAALEVFRTARRRFADELGIEPGPRLSELERRILRHDPTLLPGPALQPRAGETTHRRGDRRRWILAVTVLAVAGAAAVAVVVLWPAGGMHVGAVHSDELLRLDARSGRTRGTAALPGAPAALAGSKNSLWVTDAARNQLLRARPSDGSVADQISLSTQPGEIAVGDGSIWVASTAGPDVTRINLATDAVTQTIPVGGTPSALAFVRGALWVGDPTDGALLRVDPASGQVVQTLTVGLDPSAIASTGRTLWVAGYDTGTVVDLDPHSDTRLSTVHVGQGPAAIVFGAGSLWVANRLDGTVSRVDPATGTVVATVETGSAPSALAASGHSIWVANQYSSTVSRIDTRRNHVTSTRVGGSPTALTSSANSVWVSVRPANLHRGGTLLLATTRRFFSFDAQIDTEAPPAELLGLVDDGLVAYDHTQGPQGLNLVPDLALALPSPTDRGRTYTFRLRPGIHYSTGRLVRASDFSRGVRRLFRLGAPGASFLSRLTGGRLCLAEPRACSLTHAVAADDSSRTITFRLTSPDPDFLYKLALGFVIPVPPGTPPTDVGTHPIPGTGPYRFGTIGRREVILVRNPRFREWSHAAQPDGNPNQIEWRFGARPDQEASGVLRGRADWTGDLPSNLPLLERHHPSQIHSNVFPTDFFVQINTHDPPFDRLRARQALNYAIDRAAVVRSYGGSLANSPSCQIIPHGLPGYHRYCPYTLDPGSTGSWSAPDLRKARLLADGTRTRGAPVTIWDISDSGPEPVIPIITHTLRQLGYRPHVRVITSHEFEGTTAAERARVQLVPVTFGPDYPSAAELYALFLACRGPYNWHQFCDPRLDHEAASAEGLRLSKPTRSAKLWARIDRQLVNRAVWVPLTDQRIIDIVSRRLTGYQFSPVYHFLPAQASLRRRK